MVTTTTVVICPSVCGGDSDDWVRKHNNVKIDWLAINHTA